MNNPVDLVHNVEGDAPDHPHHRAGECRVVSVVLKGCIQAAGKQLNRFGQRAHEDENEGTDEDSAISVETCLRMLGLADVPSPSVSCRL